MTFRLTVIDRKPFSYFYKDQRGANWNSPAAPQGLQSYWARTEKSYSDALQPGFKKVRGTKRLPKRATIEDHWYQGYMIRWQCPRNAIYNEYAEPEHINLVASHDHSFYTLLGEGLNSNNGSAWDSNDDIALVGKLREKIVGSDFDMGVFLGEGKEALSLIASTAVRTRQYLVALRRGDVSGIAESLGITRKNAAKAARALGTRNRTGAPTAIALSEANLALQYGWMPLLQDAEGAAQALAQQLNNPAVQTYRARKWKPLTGVPNSSAVQVGTWFYTGKVQAQLIARLKEVNVVGLNGLLDPSSVLWELTPWSFVADWFIPIGNYLQARSLSSFVTGTFVKTVHYREFYHAETGVGLSPLFAITQQPNIYLVSTRTNRTVTDVLDVPKPGFKSLASVPSWKRAANAVSLLITGAWRHL